jgi:hypothetical protein
MASNYAVKTKRKVVFTVKLLIKVKTKIFKFRQTTTKKWLPTWAQTANTGNE